MRARVHAAELHRATAWAMKAAPVTRAYREELAGLLVEAERGFIHLTTFNEQAVAKTSVPAEVEQPGRLLASPLLATALEALGGEASAELDGDANLLHVSGRGREFRIPLLPVDKYPDVPKREPEVSAKCEGLAASMAALVPLVSSEKGTRAALMGVTMIAADGALNLYASNGYYCVGASHVWDGPDFHVILPTVGARGAAGMGDPLTVTVDERMAWFCESDAEAGSLLVAERPMDLSVMLRAREVQTTVDVDSAELIEVLQVAGRFGNAALPLADFEASDQGVVVSSAPKADHGAGIPMDGVVEGEPTWFRMNARFLADVVKATRLPRVRLSIRKGGGAAEPVHISTPGQPPVGVCMTVKV